MVYQQLKELDGFVVCLKTPFSDILNHVAELITLTGPPPPLTCS